MAGGPSGGSVPTFQEVDRQRKAGEGQGGWGMPGMFSDAGLGESIKYIQSSKGIAKISDKIKRGTGLNLNNVIGGKTVA